MQQLYVYPHRKGHNKLVEEVHDFKDELLEARIKRVLSEKQAHKTATKYLGEAKPKTYPLWWIIAVGVSIYILWN